MSQIRTIQLSESELRRYIYNRVLDEINYSSGKSLIDDYQSNPMINEGIGDTLLEMLKNAVFACAPRIGGYLEKMLGKFVKRITGVTKSGTAVGKLCGNTSECVELFLAWVGLFVGQLVTKTVSIVFHGTGRLVPYFSSGMFEKASRVLKTSFVNNFRKISDFFKTAKAAIFSVQAFKGMVSTLLSGGLKIIIDLFKKSVGGYVFTIALSMCKKACEVFNAVRTFFGGKSSGLWTITKESFEVISGFRFPDLDNSIDRGIGVSTNTKLEPFLSAIGNTGKAANYTPGVNNNGTYYARQDTSNPTQVSNVQSRTVQSIAYNRGQTRPATQGTYAKAGTNANVGYSLYNGTMKQPIQTPQQMYNPGQRYITQGTRQPQKVG